MSGSGLSPCLPILAPSDCYLRLSNATLRKRHDVFGRSPYRCDCDTPAVTGDRMNHASLSRSARLQRVAKLLETGKSYTTLAIIKKARVCAVNSIIAELRANGYKIVCTRRKDVWSYQMEIQ